MGLRKTDWTYLRDRFQVTCESLFFKFLRNPFFTTRKLEDFEDLVIFLKTKKLEYYKKNNQVSAGAFLPKEHQQRLEKSSFTLRRCSSEVKIYRLGHLWTKINPYPHKSGTSSIHGWAKFQAVQPRRLGLFIEIEPSPHPDHANLFGWSNNEPERLEIANQLALGAKLFLKK